MFSAISFMNAHLFPAPGHDIYCGKTIEIQKAGGGPIAEACVAGLATKIRIIGGCTSLASAIGYPVTEGTFLGFEKYGILQFRLKAGQ